MTATSAMDSCCSGLDSSGEDGSVDSELVSDGRDDELDDGEGRGSWWQLKGMVGQTPALARRGQLAA